MSTPPFPEKIGQEQKKTYSSLTNILDKNKQHIVYDMNYLMDMAPYDPAQAVESIEGLKKAIHQKMNQYTTYINEISKQGNINQEILLKQQELIQLENEELQNELAQLENIENDIIYKERMHAQMMEAQQKEETHISALYMCIVYVVLLIVVIFLYGFQILSMGAFYNTALILTGLFIFVLMYVYNIFYLQDSLDLFRYRRLEIMRDRLTQWGEDVDTNVKTLFKGNKKKWIDENCKCTTQEESLDYSIYKNSSNIQNRNGYFYNDNTAPAQLLIPEPSISDDSILWPDYSPDSDLTYMSTPSSNTLSRSTGSWFRNSQTYTTNL